MPTSFTEKRFHQRARVNWRVECLGTPGSHPEIHEGSRLEDYSPNGACFLTMADVKVGMELVFNVSLPLRMSRPLVLRGIIVRIDDNVDIGKMFKAAGVRWLPNQKKLPKIDQLPNVTQPLPGTSH
ncbi:MAG: PilZ domain-containing protein [Terriglobia bacterium]